MCLGPGVPMLGSVPSFSSQAALALRCREPKSMFNRLFVQHPESLPVAACPLLPAATVEEEGQGAGEAYEHSELLLYKALVLEEGEGACRASCLSACTPWPCVPVHCPRPAGAAPGGEVLNMVCWPGEQEAALKGLNPSSRTSRHAARGNA